LRNYWTALYQLELAVGGSLVNNMNRHLIFFLLIVILFASCGKGSDGSRPTQGAEQQAAAAPTSGVTIINPEYRTRTATIETTGKIQFNEERLVRVNAPLTGKVLEVLARPGDFVEPGHPLFVIDSPDLGSAKSDYAKAVSDLERSDKAFNLARDLFEVKANSEKELHDAENDYRKAAAEKERAASRLLAVGVSEAQIKDVASRADATTRIVVRAPRAGVIVERNVSPGQVVAFGQSDTPTNLFVIADLSTMWVLADVYEPDVPKIHLGQVLSLAPPCCPNQRSEGKVTYISDSVDAQTRTVKVRAIVPNPGRLLKSEMFVKVSISAGTDSILVIPQSAVHHENNETFVFVEKAKGSYERHTVKLGADLDSFVQVLDGTTPHDRVVSTGSILLKKATR
jgi:membrane fusion protein, heavy metal efflux system